MGMTCICTFRAGAVFAPPAPLPAREGPAWVVSPKRLCVPPPAQRGWPAAGLPWPEVPGGGDIGRSVRPCLPDGLPSIRGGGRKVGSYTRRDRDVCRFASASDDCRIRPVSEIPLFATARRYGPSLGRGQSGGSLPPSRQPNSTLETEQAGLLDRAQEALSQSPAIGSSTPSDSVGPFHRRGSFVHRPVIETRPRAPGGVPLRRRQRREPK